MANWDEKITIIRGTHTIKAGVYLEWFHRDIAQPVEFTGQFDFRRNADNPLDTGYAYSNAILGMYHSYTESSERPYAETRNRMLQLGRDADGRRAATHPSTGAVYPSNLIGAIAPGTGDPVNGMVVNATDSSYPRGLTESQGILFGPCVGISIDPFGKGKTAIRTGFGTFYQRRNSGTWSRIYSVQPPLLEAPVIFFEEIRNLLSSSGFLFPSDVEGIDPDRDELQLLDPAGHWLRGVSRQASIVEAGHQPDSAGCQLQPR